MGKRDPVDPNIEPSHAFSQQLIEFQNNLKTFSHLKQILHHIVFLGRDILGAQDTSIILWNSVNNQFERGASTTKIGETVSTRVRQQGGATRWIVDNKETLIVADTKQDPFTANKMIVENAIGAYIGVPILFEGEVLGVLYSLSPDPRDFSAIEISQIQNLAMVATVSIKNAQIVQSLECKVELMHKLVTETMQNLIQPLSIVVGFSELFFESLSALTNEQQRRVEIIQRSHLKMNKLICEVHRFEKLVNCYEPTLEPVCLNKVAKIVQNAVSRGMAENESKVKIVMDRSIPNVSADFDLIIELVKELTENGFRYSGAETMTIKTQKFSRHIMIAVQDHGIGLSSEQLEKIFDPFVRYNIATHGDHLGLGLTYVKTIVEKLGGYVEVQSRVGEGSEFQIYLRKFGRDAIQ